MNHLCGIILGRDTGKEASPNSLEALPGHKRVYKSTAWYQRPTIVCAVDYCVAEDETICADKAQTTDYSDNYSF